MQRLLKSLTYSTLLIISFSIKISAQDNVKKEIIGIWKPVRPYDIGAVIPDEAKQLISQAREILLKTTFYFNADQKFTIESNNSDLSLKNGHWKLDPFSGEVIIQEWKNRKEDKPVFMSIRLLKRDAKLIFVIEEFFLAFEMSKIDQN